MLEAGDTTASDIPSEWAIKRFKQLDSPGRLFARYQRIVYLHLLHINESENSDVNEG